MGTDISEVKPSGRVGAGWRETKGRKWETSVRLSTIKNTNGKKQKS